MCGSAMLPLARTCTRTPTREELGRWGGYRASAEGGGSLSEPVGWLLLDTLKQPFGISDLNI